MVRTGHLLSWMLSFQAKVGTSVTCDIVYFLLDFIWLMIWLGLINSMDTLIHSMDLYLLVLTLKLNADTKLMQICEDSL
jgi:hypothetical protein